MGCGGSKSSDVATGNTIIRRVLEKKSHSPKKSDAPIKSLEQKATDVHENPTQDANSSDKPAVVVADVKEITDNNEAKEENAVNDGAPPEDANAGKLITRDSPDQYFSMRKDEYVDVVAATGLGYLSPGTKPSEDVKKEEESPLGNDTDNSKKNEEPACSNSDDKKHEENLPENSGKPNLAEGKINEEGVADSKAPIVAEETKVESPTNEDKVTSAEGSTEVWPGDISDYSDVFKTNRTI